MQKVGQEDSCNFKANNQGYGRRYVIHGQLHNVVYVGVAIYLRLLPAIFGTRGESYIATERKSCESVATEIKMAIVGQCKKVVISS